MAPQSFVQGDTWPLVIDYFNPIPGTSPPVADPSDPMDLTGYSARLQVRAAHDQPPVLTLTSASSGGLTIDPEVPGRIHVRASPVQTSGIGPGDYIWELEIENGVDRYTLVTAQLKVKAQYSV